MPATAKEILECRNRVSAESFRLMRLRPDLFSATTWDDVFQTGMEAVIRAANRFDGSKGWKLWSFVKWNARRDMRSHINEMQSMVRKLQDGPTLPPDEDMSEALGLPTESRPDVEYQRAEEKSIAAHAIMSLDKREFDVVLARHWRTDEPESLRAIADSWGIKNSASYVLRVEQRALAKLKNEVTNLETPCPYPR